MLKAGMVDAKSEKQLFLRYKANNIGYFEGSDPMADKVPSRYR